MMPLWLMCAVKISYTHILLQSNAKCHYSGAYNVASYMHT